MRLANLFIASLLTSTAMAANTEFRLKIEDNTVPGLPLYIAIYQADASDWEAEPAHIIKKTLPNSAEFSLAVDIPAGHYAIRAFVDQDDDGLLTTNDKGRPKEPFANSISADRSRPSHHFRHAIITLSAENPEAVLTLRYPRGSRDH
ncbi:MAG TPA: DUF2141 domain-containing protein [Cellvibrionaceae bacterium]